jgi:hypothetical protein
MKLVNKKTRKAILKSVRKVIKKHGPQLAAALGGGALARALPDGLIEKDRKSAPKRSSHKASKKKKARVRKPTEEATT